MIQVSFMNGSKEATSTPLYQWDYGQELHIYGLDFSNAAVIQVHFCDRSCQRTFVRLATLDFDHYKVSIPDGLLENDFSISVFIYAKTDTSGNTTHHITIPVIPRKKPDSFISQPDASQSSQLDKALNDINDANTRLVQTAESIAGTVDDINQKIDNLENDVGTNTSDIDTLKIITSTNGNDIGEIKDKLNKVKSSYDEVSVAGLYSVDAQCVTTSSEYCFQHFSETIYVFSTDVSVRGKYFKYNADSKTFSVVESPFSGTQSRFANVYCLIKAE